MKRRKVALHRETVRVLSARDLGVAGGTLFPKLDADPKDPSNLVIKINLCPSAPYLSCEPQPICPIALSPPKLWP